jgi:hypothetical protein
MPDVEEQVSLITGHVGAATVVRCEYSRPCPAEAEGTNSDEAER